MTEGTTLLVCAQGRGEDKLAQLLRDTPYRACEAVGLAALVRREMQADRHPLVIINAPLPDESGVELALELTRETTAAVLLLLKAELAPMVEEEASTAGVLLVCKPLSAPLFLQTVRLGISCRNRLLQLKSENERLQKKLEEIRVIDRAKCLLIEHLRMTEEQAHRVLEKQAMDSRLPCVKVARKVLEQYEL